MACSCTKVFDTKFSRFRIFLRNIAIKKEYVHAIDLMHINFVMCTYLSYILSEVCITDTLITVN